MPMLSSMAQHLFHLLAPNLLLSDPPPSSWLFSPSYSLWTYIFMPFSLCFTHTHTIKVCLVQVCGLPARGPWSLPSHSPLPAALSALSVHLSLCSPLPLSSCSPSRPISQPSAHSSIAALLWVTFKDPAPLLINTETAALYSMPLFAPLLLLSSSFSKSKVLHLLMIEAISSHLYNTGIYI